MSKVKMKITVTKDILNRSKYCDGDALDIRSNCAIALAVRDIFPKATVDYTCIEPFGRSGYASYIELPKEATRFIHKFDKAGPKRRIKMDEFSFEIEIPSYVIRRINISEVKKILINHPTLEFSQTPQP